jgi:hypothetical protein
MADSNVTRGCKEVTQEVKATEINNIRIVFFISIVL